MDWQQELFSRRPRGVLLGLDRVDRVWNRLGAPGRDAFTLQIVGTNGKGSTAAMLAHGLGVHGRRVGLFTSPHLHRVGERFSVEGRPLADEAVGEAVARVLVAESACAVDLSFFELLTLAALVLFGAAGVEVMVLEAGLGGRLDATRVVPARAHLVAPIGMDHMQYLGDTLEAIAAEKLAVMTRGAPCLIASAQRPEVLRLAEARAREVGAELRVIAPAERAPARLPGPHQRDNAGLALAGVRLLHDAARLEDLDGTCWPGRFEWVEGGQGGRICFDVAHNEDGVEALLAALALEGSWERPPTGPRVVAFGCMSDKRPERLLARIRPWAAQRQARLWLISPAREGGMNAESLALPGDTVFVGGDDEGLWGALDGALAAGGEVLVCGSHVVVAGLRAHALSIPAGERDSLELSDPLRRA